MKKVLLIGLSLLAVALLLSACVRAPANSNANITAIRDAISAAASGSTVPATIEGIVTYGYGPSVVIEDKTAAIQVYVSGSKLASLYATGTKLRVYGTISQYKGNWQITPKSTEDVVKIGNGNVTPTLLPSNTALNSNYDWMLLKVENLPVEKVADKYLNVVLSNGTQSVTIYSFDSNVKAWLSKLATGDTVSIQGIVEQHYGTWKIVIRSMADVLSK